MHKAVIAGLRPDLGRIKREARARRRTQGDTAYMQHLDIVARELYGVRHFHEAQRLSQRSENAQPVPVNSYTPTQHYLRSLQEYYLDF